MQTFKALILEQQDGQVSAAIRNLQRDALPEGDLLISVAYSTLNYKDGLAVTGKGKIIRSYPMVPGVDFAGTVLESQSPNFKPGDEVIVTGWGMGERYWGGYAQMARVQSDWALKVPKGLTMERAMSIGTAGMTAMLAVIALEKHGLTADEREILVTGAAGGVGSVAVAVLAKLGYQVVASTGRMEERDYLTSLGAREVIGRLSNESRRPLETERWGGAVDTVGGATLAALLPAMSYYSSVAVCGNAGGIEFTSTVFPFILRGVNLLGIDSVMCSIPRRREAWERLVRDLPTDSLDSMTHVVALEEIPALGEQILKGRVRGRIVVDLSR